jgi:hypothetical protein
MKGMIRTLNFLLLSMLEPLIQIGFHMLGVVSVTALPFRDLSTIHLLNFIYKFHSLGMHHTLFCTCHAFLPTSICLFRDSTIAGPIYLNDLRE